MGLWAVASVVSARRVRIALILSIVALPPLGTSLRAGTSGSEVERKGTQEYVDRQPWWPTKLLPSRKDYVGSEACAQCHASVTYSAKGTEMAKALLRPDESEVLRARNSQSFQLDSYVYTLERTPQGHLFTVRHGAEVTSQPITWAFGEGRVSQVYVTEKQGTFYESHFSYYGGIDGFDRTTNQSLRADSLQTGSGTHRSAGGDPQVFFVPCCGGYTFRRIQRGNSWCHVRSVPWTGRGPCRSHEGGR